MNDYIDFQSYNANISRHSLELVLEVMKSKGLQYCNLQELFYLLQQVQLDTEISSPCHSPESHNFPFKTPAKLFTPVKPTKSIVDEKVGEMKSMHPDFECVNKISPSPEDPSTTSCGFEGTFPCDNKKASFALGVDTSDSKVGVRGKKVKTPNKKAAKTINGKVGFVSPSNLPTAPSTHEGGWYWGQSVPSISKLNASMGTPMSTEEDLGMSKLDESSNFHEYGSPDTATVAANVGAYSTPQSTNLCMESPCLLPMPTSSLPANIEILNDSFAGMQFSIGKKTPSATPTTARKKVSPSRKGKDSRSTSKKGKTGGSKVPFISPLPKQPGDEAPSWWDSPCRTTIDTDEMSYGTATGPSGFGATEDDSKVDHGEIIFGRWSDNDPNLEEGEVPCADEDDDDDDEFVFGISKIHLSSKEEGSSSSSSSSSSSITPPSPPLSFATPPLSTAPPPPPIRQARPPPPAVPPSSPVRAGLTGPAWASSSPSQYRAESSSFSFTAGSIAPPMTTGSNSSNPTKSKIPPPRPDGPPPPSSTAFQPPPPPSPPSIPTAFTIPTPMPPPPPEVCRNPTPQAPEPAGVFSGAGFPSSQPPPVAPASSFHHFSPPPPPPASVFHSGVSAPPQTKMQTTAQGCAQAFAAATAPSPTASSSSSSTSSSTSFSPSSGLFSSPPPVQPMHDESQVRMIELSEMYRKQGRELYDAEIYERAVDAFDKAINCAPASWKQRAAILGNRAAAMFMLERYVEAIADCDKAVQEDPSLLRLHVRKGKALLRLGEISGADESLVRILESSSAQEAIKADAKKALKEVNVAGRAIKRLGELEATADYAGLLLAAEELIEICPMSRLVHAAKATALCRLKRWGEAKDFIDFLLSECHPSVHALSAHPNSTLEVPNAGQLQFGEVSTPSSAAKSPKSQSRVATANCGVIVCALHIMGSSLAKVYISCLKNVDACRSSCQEVLDGVVTILQMLDSENSKSSLPRAAPMSEGAGGTAFSSRATKVVYRGQSSTAEWCWIGTELKRVQQFVAMKSSADSAFRAGRFQESIRTYGDALKVDSEAVRWVAILYCNRAAAHMALQAYTEAVADCHQAITRDSDLSKAYLRRARAYGALKQFAASVRDYRRYLSADPTPADHSEVDTELDEVLKEQRRLLRENQMRQEREKEEQQRQKQEQQRQQQQKQNQQQHQSKSRSHSTWSTEEDERFEYFKDYFRTGSAGPSGRPGAGAKPGASKGHASGSGWGAGPGAGSRQQRRAPATDSSDEENKEPDHYSVLGVHARASEREIKIAYRQMALKFHPDKNKDAGAEDIFKSVTSAYSVLSDKTTRDRYDRTRSFR